MEELQTRISNKVYGEVEDKCRVLNEHAREKEESGDFEELIQVRAHQLALNRILVNVHNRSPFLLVIAYTNLGESYLKYDYYEQATEHIKNALRLNGSILNSHPESKEQQIHLLVQLAKCYLFANCQEDALSLLEKALKLSKNLQGDEHISQAPILTEIALIQSRNKDFSKAIDNLTSVWEIYEGQYGAKDKIMIGVYHNLAEVYKLNNDRSSAIDALKRKFHLLIDLEIVDEKTVLVGEKLAAWLKEGGNFIEALDVLNKCERISESINGVTHRSTAKVKRMKCMILIKVERYEEALKECFELIEIDKFVFGIVSANHAKDLKVIGSVMVLLKRLDEASDYYTNSLEIYTKLKNKKSIKNVREKLESLKIIRSDN